MPWRLVLGGGVAVVVFDALAALASKTLEFDYALAELGSVLIYVAAGYAVGRVRGDLRACSVAGALVSLVDATAGWAVSAAIGPGRIEGAGAFIVVATIVGVVLVGALLGWIGGRLARARGGA
ncbi:MAG: hypothetical protein ACRDLN_12475 [Solirubrobacteraceae bacterium]